MIERRCLATVVKRGYPLAFVVLALGALCLFVDLGRPEVAYLLFTRPTLSYISVGAYSLTALMVCVAYLALIDTFALPKRLGRARPIVLLLGFVAAVIVMVYTGVFLQHMNAVPLWDSPWLIVLFFLSALSTGVALVLLCLVGLQAGTPHGRLGRRLSQIDLAAIVLELGATIVFLFAVSDVELGSQAVARLLTGDWSLAFVGGYAVCGLVVPGILNGIAVARGHRERIGLAVAGLVLIGGFCLRLSLVGAGIHSSI